MKKEKYGRLEGKCLIGCEDTLDTNLLNLPNFVILDKNENKDDYFIRVKSVEPQMICPNCSMQINIIRFGTREFFYMDTSMHGKRVGIAVDRQKFRCKNCSKIFYEQLPDIDFKRAATKRLVAYIEKQSLKRSHASIAEEVGVDEKTVRNIFRDYVNRLEKNLQIELPQWLGIDEIHIIGKPRCVLTNIEKRTLIDILPKRDKATLVNYYLIKLPNKNRVQYVCMDMWEPYRSAIQAVIPQAKIIIDKFHVLRMANQALEIVKKDIRAGLTLKERRTLMHDRHILLKRKNELDVRELLILEYWVKNFENLGAAYELKETFYGIWESKNKLEATEKYKEWQSRLPENIKYAYQPLLTALTNWGKEIFSYFDHKITNAYTESLNNLIRALNRLGRGYSFETLRAKVLFTKGFEKQAGRNIKSKIL